MKPKKKPFFIFNVEKRRKGGTNNRNVSYSFFSLIIESYFDKIFQSMLSKWKREKGRGRGKMGERERKRERERERKRARESKRERERDGAEERTIRLRSMSCQRLSGQNSS